MQPKERYTAAQTILLAADDLAREGATEIAEARLVVAAWERDRERFGLRGFEQLHPNSHRVLMEVCGKKPQNPLLLGLMQRPRPNTYTVTPLGKAEAARLRQHGGIDYRYAASTPTMTKFPEYDAVKPFVTSPVFLRWREDPDTPRQFVDVMTFVGMPPHGHKRLASARLLEIRGVVRAAMDWCNRHNVDRLTKGPKSADLPILYQTLSELLDFLQALQYRFPALARAAS